MLLELGGVETSAAELPPPAPEPAKPTHTKAKQPAKIPAKIPKAPQAPPPGGAEAEKKQVEVKLDPNDPFYEYKKVLTGGVRKEKYERIFEGDKRLVLRTIATKPL